MKKKIWKKWALVGKDNIYVLDAKPKKSDDKKNWWIYHMYNFSCKEYKLKLVEVKICK